MFIETKFFEIISLNKPQCGRTLFESLHRDFIIPDNAALLIPKENKLSLMS